MNYNKEEIIKLFKTKKSGSKGWVVGVCPYCGKENHLAIIFGKISSFHCLKCGKHGTLWELLKKVNRLDLLTQYKNVDLNKSFLKLLIDKEEEINYKMPFHSLPIGFKRLFNSQYLNSRGFTQVDYERYPVGETKLDPIFKNDYIIIPIYDENETKGFFARSTKNNNWIEKYNLWARKNGKREYLRYRNSEADFSKYLYGINEINEETVVVIIVEGFFDKVSVDRNLNLFESNIIKCVASFGKKISREQIKRLQDKNVHQIILLYDADALKASKEYSLKLNDYFEVEVGYISNSKDPGDMEQKELLEVLRSTEDVVSFYFSKLESKKL